MEDCRSRQLRPKTMISYEQTLKLFSLWIEEQKGIFKVEDIKEKHIREYIIELQTRGKYICPRQRVCMLFACVYATRNVTPLK